MRFTGMFLLLVLPLSAQAFDFSYSGSRQGDKTQTRWTITDYLAQKNRVQLMDNWLSMNRSSNTFEIYFGGGPVSYTQTESTGSGGTTRRTELSQNYRLAMYAWIFGLEGEYQKSNLDYEAWSAAVALRLLGTSNQNTNLTVKYGIQETKDLSVTPAEVWTNQFAEASLSLYIIDFVGLSGLYRYYLPDQSSSGIDLSGTRTSAGIFLEYGVFRAYADYIQERFEYNNAGSVTQKNRDGLEYGVRFYF